MRKRRLGKTGFDVSEVSLGTWQVGGRWGTDFDFDMAEDILATAVDQGINFFDTADGYGDRNSEKAIGKFLKKSQDNIYVATKCGRRLNPHNNANYTETALRGFVEDSLANMDLECLDLIQLHCPPPEVYERPEIFGLFERLQEEGKIKHMGVSVETCSEALRAMDYPNVCTIQIIFNMFRHKPAEKVFNKAAQLNVGILARVPLASGLLTGTYTADTVFEKNDHRNFNRNGEYFDKGETFSGVPYETGLAAVEELKKLLPDVPLPQLALKWIIMFPEVTCVIPGASSPGQVVSNAGAGRLADLDQVQMAAVRDVYDQMIREHVHHLW